MEALLDVDLFDIKLARPSPSMFNHGHIIETFISKVKFPDSLFEDIFNCEIPLWFASQKNARLSAVTCESSLQQNLPPVRRRPVAASRWRLLLAAADLLHLGKQTADPEDSRGDSPDRDEELPAVHLLLHQVVDCRKRHGRRLGGCHYRNRRRAAVSIPAPP